MASQAAIELVKKKLYDEVTACNRMQLVLKHKTGNTSKIQNYFGPYCTWSGSWSICHVWKNESRSLELHIVSWQYVEERLCIVDVTALAECYWFRDKMTNPNNQNNTKVIGILALVSAMCTCWSGNSKRAWMWSTITISDRRRTEVDPPSL